ncbi:MAG: thioredoxin [bacterium]|nr:thioredoxin [bacterium]
MIEANDTTFQKEVLEKSKEVPVLVDFWASWCMPCRMLAPILEKAEKEHAGKFILAKVNTDESQEISSRYGIMSIPSVKLFKGGEMVDEFVGVVPEQVLKTFLSKHIS